MAAYNKNKGRMLSVRATFHHSPITLNIFDNPVYQRLGLYVIRGTLPLGALEFKKGRLGTSWKESK